eukprot:Rmarinus@m.17551
MRVVVWWVLCFVAWAVALMEQDEDVVVLDWEAAASKLEEDIYWGTRATRAWEEGDFEAMYEGAIQSDTCSGYYCRAQYFLSKKNWKEMVYWLEYTVSRCPNPCAYKGALSAFNFQMGDKEKAFSLAVDALRLNPTCQQALDVMRGLQQHVPQENPIDVAGHVYMTAVIGDEYVPGAQALAASLRNSGSSRKLVALGAMLSEQAIDALTAAGCVVREVSPWVQTEDPHLRSLTALDVFNQTDWDVIVFLHADTLVVHNQDRMFYAQGDLSCFRASNGSLDTTIMTVRPNSKTYSQLRYRWEKGLFHTNPHRQPSFKDILDSHFGYTEAGNEIDSAITLSTVDLDHIYNPAKYSVWHYEGNPKPWAVLPHRPIDFDADYVSLQHYMFSTWHTFGDVPSDKLHPLLLDASLSKRPPGRTPTLIPNVLHINGINNQLLHVLGVLTMAEWARQYDEIWNKRGGLRSGKPIRVVLPPVALEHFSGAKKPNSLTEYRATFTPSQSFKKFFTVFDRVAFERAVHVIDPDIELTDDWGLYQGLTGIRAPVSEQTLRDGLAQYDNFYVNVGFFKSTPTAWTPALRGIQCLAMMHGTLLNEELTSAATSLIASLGGVGRFNAVHVRVEWELRQCLAENEGRIYLTLKSNIMPQKCYTPEDVPEICAYVASRASVDPALPTVLIGGSGLGEAGVLEAFQACGLQNVTTVDQRLPAAFAGLKSAERALVNAVVARHARAFVGYSQSTFSLSVVSWREYFSAEAGSAVWYPSYYYNEAEPSQYTHDPNFIEEAKHWMDPVKYCHPSALQPPTSVEAHQSLSTSPTPDSDIFGSLRRFEFIKTMAQRETPEDVQLLRLLDESAIGLRWQLAAQMRAAGFKRDSGKAPAAA